MRICFWTTTFQADTLALAHHLAAQPDCEVCIVADCAALAVQTASLLPALRARFLDRNARSTRRELERAGFDLMVIDNHLPPYRVAERVFVLWHGFGWRYDDLKTMRRELTRWVGPVTEANPRFRWQALGSWDRAYRIDHSRLHPDNVHALGSPYSDWLSPHGTAARSLREAAHAERDAQPRVLLALTWHHGGALSHWGDEERLLEALVRHITARGAHTLLRMHDRRRYRSEVIQRVERLARRGGSTLQLKWKDTSPDSLGDLLGSDVCISNYSSILNHYYFTQRPSIHIDPHDVSATFQRSYRMFLGRPLARWVRSPERIWKLPLEEHGGLRAHSFEQLLAQVDLALDRPDCCAERARSFVERYVTEPNGESCARTESFLRTWLGHTTSVAAATSRPVVAGADVPAGPA